MAYRNNELAEQLKLTEQLNDAFDKMASNIDRMSHAIQTQTNATEKLLRVFEQLNNSNLDNLNTDALSKLQQDASEAEESTDKFSESLQKAGEVAEKGFNSKLLIATGALSGLHQGFKNVIAVGSGLLGFFSSAAKGVGRIALSVLAFPFKMFSALVSSAAEGGGDNSLATALENLRKQMGDLKGPGSSAVITASKALSGFADTGLNAFRIFGTLAERLTLVTEVAGAMGATFGVLKQEFIDNGGALLAFQKGLGITNEEMKGLGDRSITMGKPFSKVMLDMTKQTVALGKAFDVDQKLIGKDMAKAMQNVKHFGALAVKEIATASVYARKLGVELESITGVLDAFETFDSAAENVAKLSQTFGVQLDTFELMESQDPAENIDKLRKAFRAAGVDSSAFTRQQAKALAMSTGLDEKTARQVFSMENYGVSLDDVKKKSEGAEKKQKTQAEAMSDLADSIERMVKSGGELNNTFFKQFTEGFKRAIRYSAEYRAMDMAIRRSLIQTGIAGFNLGKVFVKNFDGVKDLLNGLTSFFSKIGTLATEVSKISQEFMKGEITFEKFMEKLRSKFINFFTENSPAFKKMLDGFKKIFVKLSKIAGEGIVWMSKQIAEGLKAITELITDPSKFKAKMASGAGGAMGFLAEILIPLGKAIADGAKIIWPHAVTLFKLVTNKIKAYLTSPAFFQLIKPAIIPMATMFFGPMFGKALLGAITSSIGSSIFSSSGLSVLKKAFSTGLGKLFAGAGGIAAAIGASMSIGKAIREMKDQISSEFSDADRTIAAGATGLIDALTLGLLPPGFKLQIANAIAELSTALFDELEKKFGSAFSSSLKDYLADQLNFIGKIGDVFTALFAEDDDMLEGAITELGSAFLKAMQSAGEFLLFRLPTKLAELALKIWNSLNKAFISLISKAFKGLGKALLGAIKPEWAEGFGEFVDDVSSTMKNLSDTIIGGSSKVLGRLGSLKKSSALAPSQGTSGSANPAEFFGMPTTDELLAAAKKQAKEKEGGISDYSVKGDKSAAEVAQNIGEIQSLEKVLQDKSLDLEKLTSGVREKLKDVNFDLGLTDEKAEELQNAAESANKMSVLFGSVNNAFSSMASIPGNIEKTVNMIKTGALKPAMEAVAKMVELANEMDTTLSSGLKVETTAKLASFANSVGLGAKAKYTVTNKDIVINLDLKVEMNVDDVERVMIMRKKSIIRDQLNFALEHPDKQATGATPIPDTLQKAYSSEAKPKP
jgi:hypothetical protein